jgi:hypothetical protein
MCLSADTQRFLLFLVYLVVLSFNILLGCVYTLNIHDIHECSVVCTYMCWCTHTRNGMHTTAHKQHTPCREEPFFMAGVVETTGTGRNNPCSASTTLLIIFSSPTFRTCPCRAFRVAIGYTNSTPSTQIRANTTILLAWWQKQCEDHCLEHQGSPYA